MTVIPPIISVDDHVIEPPDLWRRRLPAGLRELGPRIVRAPYEMVRTDRQPFRRAASGPETDFWEYEGETNAIMSVMACAGKTDDEISLGPIRFDAMRPGCFDVAARLADMDVNHVERSLCFPTYPRFCGQTFLEAKAQRLALACVRAYNDWMVRSGRARAAAGSSRCASSRCGIPSPPVTRCAATRRAGCARSRSASCHRSSDCRACTMPAVIGSRSSPRATRRRR
jgi:hypothetical protein